MHYTKMSKFISYKANLKINNGVECIIIVNTLCIIVNYSVQHLCEWVRLNIFM